MTISEIGKKIFRRSCINRLPCKNEKGELQWYRHPAIHKLSEEAFNNGDDCFYLEKEGSNFKAGKPKYIYIAELSEEDYTKLFGSYDIDITERK